MPVNSRDLELPGMERPWFYQNINNQLREVQKQQEGGTNRHLIQVVFFQNILESAKRRLVVGLVYLVWYSAFNLKKIFVVLFTYPKIWFAFVLCDFTCLFHERSDEIHTARSRSWKHAMVELRIFHGV
jgi:hypothetical protein